MSYWKVRYYDSEDLPSEWSDVFMFTTVPETVNTKPDRPRPDSPADNESGGGRPVTLSTLGFSDPDEDDVHLKTLWQVSVDEDFSDIVFSEESTTNLTSVTIGESHLNYGTGYYWRVRFFDRDNLSEWSDIHVYDFRSRHSGK